MNAMTTRIVALIILGLAGAFALGAQPADGVYPSEQYLRSQLRPAGEFAPTVQKLIDQLEGSTAEGDKCDVALGLGQMFWWLTESERRSIDQKMIQALTGVLVHAAQDDGSGCVEFQVASALGLIGPPARAALPGLKARLVAVKAIMAAQDAETRAAYAAPFFLPERRLDYALEKAIAQIDVPDKPGPLK